MRGAAAAVIGSLGTRIDIGILLDEAVRPDGAFERQGELQAVFPAKRGPGDAEHGSARNAEVIRIMLHRSNAAAFDPLRLS